MMDSSRFCRFVPAGVAGLSLLWAVTLPAAVVGTNIAVQPLTPRSIAQLPASQRPPWQDYLKRSQAQLQTDQDFLKKELQHHKLTQCTFPQGDRSTRSLPLLRPADWYASEEARRRADNVVSFQTPAGGWTKNLSFTNEPRAAGMTFAPDGTNLLLTSFDNDTPHPGKWNYIGTFDNNATTTQLRFLARVIHANDARKSAAWRKAFLHGLDYIFAAQYPNGGWPQVWPLQGGYHDAITYNDGAMFHIISLLQDVAANQDNDFTFVPPKIRARASASVKRAQECVLASQIVVDGRRTGWCQQHDALTLQPTAARNYEMPCQSSSESADLIMFLMKLPDPSPPAVAAVHAAAAWLKKTMIHDVAIERSKTEGRHLVREPGAAPLWARYYEIGSDTPIFGDRDKTIHDNLEDISWERRNGYGWYGGSPAPALLYYDVWRRLHPPLNAHLP